MQIEGLLLDLTEEIGSGSYTDSIGRVVGADSTGDFVAVPSGGLTDLSTFDPQSGLSLAAAPPPVSDLGDDEDDGGISAGASARNALLDDSPAVCRSDDATAQSRHVCRSAPPGAAAEPAHGHGPKPNRHQPQAAIASVAAKLAAALQPLQGRSTALSRPHRSAVYELLSSTCESIPERSWMAAQGDLSARSGFEASPIMHHMPGQEMFTAPPEAAAAGARDAAAAVPHHLDLHEGSVQIRVEMMHDDAGGEAVRSSVDEESVGTEHGQHGQHGQLAQREEAGGRAAAPASASQQHRIPRRQLLHRLMQQEPHSRQQRQPPPRQQMYLHRPFVSGGGDAAPSPGGVSDAEGSPEVAPRKPQRSFLRSPVPWQENSSSAALSDTSSLAAQSVSGRPGRRAAGFARSMSRLRPQGRAAAQLSRVHSVPPGTHPSGHDSNHDSQGAPLLAAALPTLLHPHSGGDTTPTWGNVVDALAHASPGPCECTLHRRCVYAHRLLGPVNASHT